MYIGNLVGGTFEKYCCRFDVSHLVYIIYSTRSSFYLRLVFMHLVLYSLMKSIQYVVKGVVTVNMKQVDVSNQNYSFKWMVSIMLYCK